MKRWLMKMLKPAITILLWEFVQQVQERSGKVSYDDVEAYINRKL